MNFLPRDFVETREGLIFAVVDHTLENDRVLCFLRYAPGPQGPAKLATRDANALLHHHHPHYLYYSRRLDAHLHAVSLEDIVCHHRPREKLRILRERGAKDAIEARLLRLVALLESREVPDTQLGVTGSVLIGQHNPLSDIDLVVYGREPFFKARARISLLIECGELGQLKGKDWREAYLRRGCVLDFAEFVRHERRKGNKGLIEGTKFDLTLVEEVRNDGETAIWRKTGQAVIRARVVEDAHAFDQPACYRLDHPEIGEALSFTHTYIGQARRGELIEAKGAVESSAGGCKRLVIGSSREAPGEYIRVLWGL